MSERQFDTMNDAEANETGTSKREVLEDPQITVADTGWSEDEKQRMKQHGYDSLDMVRAWYS